MVAGGRRAEMLAIQQASVQRPEDALIARCRAGDLDAFGQVYAEHERTVFRFAYRLLNHRDIIVLRDLEDLSYDEIAEVMGCSRASVKLRLFRARRRLKERVESLLAPRG